MWMWDLSQPALDATVLHIRVKRKHKGMKPQVLQGNRDVRWMREIYLQNMYCIILSHNHVPMPHKYWLGPSCLDSTIPTNLVISPCGQETASKYFAKPPHMIETIWNHMICLNGLVDTQIESNYVCYCMFFWICGPLLAHGDSPCALWNQAFSWFPHLFCRWPSPPREFPFFHENLQSPIARVPDRVASKTCADAADPNMAKAPSSYWHSWSV